MATAAELQQFAEDHRELLSYGPRFSRGVPDAVARVWDVVTRLGREDAADHFLDEARRGAGEPTARVRGGVYYSVLQYGASSLTSPPDDWAVQADHLVDSDQEPYVAEELRREDAEHLAARRSRQAQLAPDHPRVDRSTPYISRAAAWAPEGGASPCYSPPSPPARSGRSSGSPSSTPRWFTPILGRASTRTNTRPTGIPSGWGMARRWGAPGAMHGLAVLRGSEPDDERRALEEAWSVHADG